MSELIWEEPDSDGRGKARKNWASVAEQLRALPGQWAVIDTDLPSSSATRYRQGKNRAFPAGQFEFVTRGVDRSGRAGKLYARYVGDA